MKFNWGTGIVIAFALFMTFILSYVFKVQSNDKYDHELVVEDYYKKEALVQGDIEMHLGVVFCELGSKINLLSCISWKSFDISKNIDFYVIAMNFLNFRLNEFDKDVHKTIDFITWSFPIFS